MLYICLSVIAVYIVIVFTYSTIVEYRQTDEEWAKNHGLIAYIFYHQGYRGRELRKRLRRSKSSFRMYMKLLR